MAYTSVLDHIITISKDDPIEAAIMLVQSTTTHDPADPFKLPWSVDAAITAYRRVVGPLTPEEEALVRAAVA